MNQIPNIEEAVSLIVEMKVHGDAELEEDVRTVLHQEIQKAYTKGRSDEAKTCQGCQGKCEQEIQKARLSERWRCAGIVANYKTPPNINLKEERRINNLLDAVMEDISDPEQMPIDDNGKFIYHPGLDQPKK